MKYLIIIASLSIISFVAAAQSRPTTDLSKVVRNEIGASGRTINTSAPANRPSGDLNKVVRIESDRPIMSNTNAQRTPVDLNKVQRDIVRKEDEPKEDER